MNLPTTTLIRLGLLRLPLAMLELPLFVWLPSLYARAGLSLASIGLVLLVVRFVDAIADPYIGQWLDRSSRSHQVSILLGLPFLGVGFAMTLFPLGQGVALLSWLAISSIVVYLSYSVVSIAYQALCASLGTREQDKSKVTVWREGLGLVGVILASTQVKDSGSQLVLLLLFVCFLLAAAWALKGLILQSHPGPKKSAGISDSFSPWSLLGLNPEFGRLMLVFILNGIATAIPASLLLFYATDVLGLADKVPWFLSAYFLTGAIGLPLWQQLAKRVGLKGSWLLGMCIAVSVFIWALLLNKGDFWAFFSICALSGLALGADLALPSAMLAMIVQRQPARLQQAGVSEARYFGLWSLATKANLALAVGLALPLLQAAGYRASSAEQALVMPTWLGFPIVAIAYAGLPCLLKLAAAALLSSYKTYPQQPTLNNLTPN